MKEFLRQTKATALDAIALYFAPMRAFWFWLIVVAFTFYLYLR